MKNKKIQADVEKIRISLNESIQVLGNAQSSVRASDVSIVKARQAIFEAQQCVESAHKLLDAAPLANHPLRSTVFQCVKYDFPPAQIQGELIRELRYFSYLVYQLIRLDPYYLELHQHCHRLAASLDSLSE